MLHLIVWRTLAAIVVMTGAKQNQVMLYEEQNPKEG